MEFSPKSIRTFIGAQDFKQSREFYKDLGFTELPTSEKMSYFHTNGFGFYLQDYYVKDWAENSMVFLEISNLVEKHREICSLGLDQKYQGVKVSEIHHNEWGDEFFVHDPSGILWHIGTFKKIKHTQA